MDQKTQTGQQCANTVGTLGGGSGNVFDGLHMRIVSVENIVLLQPIASGINVIRGKAGFPNGGSRFQ